jgi:hypothetical protein
MQSAFILASGAGGLGFALLLWRLVLRRAYEAAHGGIRITAVSLGALARVTKVVLATALPPPPLPAHSSFTMAHQLATCAGPSGVTMRGAVVTIPSTISVASVSVSLARCA